jgi:hypothetical protein
MSFVVLRPTSNDLSAVPAAVALAKAALIAPASDL